MPPVATPLPSESQAVPKPKRARRSAYRRAPGRPPAHGGAMLARVLGPIRLDRIDGRSQVGVALRRAREDLIAHLGNDPTAVEAVLIEEAAKARVITAAVGDWILRQQQLVRDGELLPVVEAHARMQNNLCKLLRTLGLKRAAREVSIAEQLQQLHRERETQ